MKTTLDVARAGRQEFLLEGHPTSVSEARAKLVELAAPFVEEARLPDLALVISEVVSNAVRHGSEAGAILMAATPKDDYLCVQVTDSGAGLAPRPRATAPDEDGGWGFFLIEHLTRRWGLTREKGHTRVWFEYDFRAAT
jgi:anti-sigma regulatory factor (Ser/Thr protein kinase)